MLEKEDLAAVLEVARRGGDFAEIFLEERRTTQITCEDDKIERLTAGSERGAGIRVLKGGATAYGYSNDLSREGLLALARQVAAAAQAGALEPVALRGAEAVAPLCIERRPDAVDVAEKVRLVEEANQAARQADPERVRQVTVSYGDVVQEVVIANTEGLYVEDERVRVRLAVNVVASEAGVIQTGHEACGGTRGLELFRGEEPWRLGAEAARRALLSLRARPAPAGRMSVVLAAEAGGTMIHEACGHGLEADLVQKGLSVYAGKVGEKVASDLVTVVDDGTLPGKYGSYRYDDEGHPARRTVLIEEGYLRGYLYDYLTSRKDGASPTGNGRRESYQHKPLPRMSNTYLAPGDATPEEIIRETKRGLLVRKMGGGQVNTANGDFVFEVAEGYLIEDGEVTVPVRGATLTGNGPEVLRTIDLVGRDLGFGIGTCGKEGQGVPVSDAQPTIRIPELVVGGTLAGEGK